jgi:hypothetical protein
MADYETKIKDFNETVKRRLHLDFFEPSDQLQDTFSNLTPVLATQNLRCSNAASGTLQTCQVVRLVNFAA